MYILLRGDKMENIKENFLAKTFLWMFMGLFATGLISYFTYSSGLALNLLFEGAFGALCIVEVAVVLIFSLLFRKLPPNVVAALYFIYAIVNGVSLSVIFYAFEISSITMVFFGAAAVFGIFAFLGYKTNADLSKLGTICLGVLFVGILISIINLFLGNAMIDVIMDWVVLILFFGITAWDVQKLKSWQASGAIADEKLHIYGAMQIYLDFINIFLRILSRFGKRK